MVQPSTVNRTELGAKECQDALSLQYGLDNSDLTKSCDCCNAALSICYALDCNKGGLVTARHNEIRDGVADLSENYLFPHTFATTPSSFQFAPCKVQRLIRMGTHPLH